MNFIKKIILGLLVASYVSVGNVLFSANRNIHKKILNLLKPVES